MRDKSQTRIPQVRRSATVASVPGSLQRRSICSPVSMIGAKDASTTFELMWSDVHLADPLMLHKDIL